MSPYTLTILLLSLGLGTTLTFMTSHWLLAWMGLEINTLAILPLMAQHHHPRAVEATTKYFLAQAAAAATILFASTINAWTTGEWNIFCLSNPIAITLITMALALKVGLAPTHFWMPPVMQGLDLTTGLIMATWQKLAPFALIIQTAPYANPQLLIALGLLSALIGGWGGLNQTQLRKILAYSSIAHLGWIVMISQFNQQLTMLVLITYFIMTSATFLVFKLMSTTKINTLAMAWTKAPSTAALASLTLLSLGGLPPLTGFLPKWLILQDLTAQGLPLTAVTLALASLMSLYFYLRLCYAMILTTAPNTNNSSTPWRLQTKKNTVPLAAFMTSALTLLPLAPLAQALVN
uniref:NADH-ubiquinone oxidoreductase chain 2 n=1 Tax=Pareuchiloglanis longicauda TaxID=1677762 RepID=A0A0R7FJD8_9TELE|nr:NADH dehydrogenase subunit 2 [Pareuchiloglanis longicauda]AKO72148.1 NADH dehydrogenase subunit 2 [Pareuchiloglanis longicauda]